MHRRPRHPSRTPATTSTPVPPRTPAPSRTPEPSRARPPRGPGAHELGQNHLRDRRTIERIVRRVEEVPGDIVDWGAGDGVLTLALLRLDRPIEAVEIDPRAAHVLARRAAAQEAGSADRLRILQQDLLRHRPAPGTVVVANLPFHLTTAALRHLLSSRGWRRAVLVTQWEVARKRAGVGGATMMTAQWWPWYEVRLDGRIPQSAFRPRPGVDAGLLVVDRRRRPLLPAAEQGEHQRFVRRVFTGPGRGIAQVLQRAGGLGEAAARDFCARHGYAPTALPREVDPAHWIDARAASRPGRRGR